MSAQLMVVLNILVHHVAKVTLIEHSDLVEDLSAKCTDQPFNKRILPRRVRGSDDTFNTQTCDPTLHRPAISGVAISD